MFVVLIVEDELLEQDFLRTIAADAFLPDDILLTCETGVEAVALAKQHRPDIIIMDEKTPELDSINVIEEIRKFLPDACISILSAYSDFSYAQRASRINIFEHLFKPIRPADFKQALCRMIESASKKHTSSTNQTALSSPATKNERQSFIENSLLYIREHFKDKLTLEAVASKVFVNPKYFSHVFRREMGVSFTEYVSSLKIEFACKLLATTDYHTYRISLECGFSDPSYFNRVFCAQMNMTPQTYRKHANSYRNDNEQEMALL